MSRSRNDHQSRGHRRSNGRLSAFALAVICVVGVVATVNLAVGLIQVGVIGGLNKRLSAVETLAASDEAGFGTAPSSTSTSTSRSDTHAVSRMQAWTVSVFPLPKRSVSLDSVAVGAVAAGTFVHSGSWIALNEHDKHDGLLVPGSVALNIKGVFLPENNNRYVFRLDLKYNGALKVENRSTVFACYGRFGAGRSQNILSGKILFHSLQNQSRHRTLMAQKSVPMREGTPYQLNTTVYCNLPAGVRANDVLFRLSVRRADEAVFSSVRSILWPSDEYPTAAQKSVTPSPQSVPHSKRPTSPPPRGKAI